MDWIEESEGEDLGQMVAVSGQTSGVEKTTQPSRSSLKLEPLYDAGVETPLAKSNSEDWKHLSALAA
jgi:hypothetical protein